LSQDLDILRAVGGDLQHVPIVDKENVIFPCLYKTVLQTRTNKSEQAKAAAANAITVLNCCDQFEFNDADFSGCEFPKAILSSGIFEGVNFEGCNLEGVQFDGSKLEKCNFKNANMVNCEFGVLPGIKGNFGEINCV